MRNRGRVVDKKYLILRFDIFNQITKSKNEEKVRQTMHKYLGEWTDFHFELIEKFCSKTIEEIRNEYDVVPEGEKIYKRYKKPYIIGAIPIADDIMEEELGLIFEDHWMYQYCLIPRSNYGLISFFTKQTFSFNVKVVKTI